MVRQSSRGHAGFHEVVEQFFLPVAPVEPVGDLGEIRLQVLVEGARTRPVDGGLGIGDHPMDLGTSLPVALGSWSTTLQQVQGHCKLSQ